MDISAQYLEGGPEAAAISPAEARSRLHETLERVPLRMILLGWDLDPRVVEACAAECGRHGCDLYLWQPVLTGHGAFAGDARWRVVALNGEPAAGPEGKLEFTFMCPNHPEARESIQQNLSQALRGGHYQGVFLDRIRYPSPASDFAGQFGCFCEACRAAARAVDLDLAAVQDALRHLIERREGRQAAVTAMLGAGTPSEETELHWLRRMLEFRERSVSAFVSGIAQASHEAGLKVGLDCFSPTLARMVGQDLPAMAECADWIKVMTYARLCAPASLSYEITGLADWLMSAEEETEQEALECLATATGWALPRSRATMRGDLPASILTQELERGRLARTQQLLAGIELVDMPGVTQLNAAQMGVDAQAVQAASPDGVVLCWDLWRMPRERVELAGALYGG